MEILRTSQVEQSAELERDVGVDVFDRLITNLFTKQPLINIL